MKTNIKRNLFLTVSLLLILALYSSCSQPTVTPGGTNIEAGSIWRVNARVWAGQQTPLPELVDDLEATLPANSWITTNEGGVAKMKLGSCEFVYLYNDGTLNKSGCQTGSLDSGNWLCNGAIDISCESKLEIFTPSAAIEVAGTWLSVIYLPDSQLTIVQVFQGRVNVRPALAMAKVGTTTTFSQTPIEVIQDNFLFTTPGNISRNIDTFNGRTLIPFDQYLQFKADVVKFDLNGGSKLDNWMAQIYLRAVNDNQTFPGIFLPNTVLNGAGPLLSIPQVQDAVLSAVDWSQFNKQAFPGSTNPLAAVFPGRSLSYQTSWRFDLNAAQSTIKKLGLNDAQRTLTIVAPEYNYNFLVLNDQAASMLKELGLIVKVVTVKPIEMDKYLSQSLKEGSSLLWIRNNRLQP